MKKIQAVIYAGVLVSALMSAVPAAVPAQASTWTPNPQAVTALDRVTGQKPNAQVAPVVDGFGQTNNTSDTVPTWVWWQTNQDTPNEIRYENMSYNAVQGGTNLEQVYGSSAYPSRLGIDTSFGQRGDPPGASSEMQEASVCGSPCTNTSSPNGFLAWIEDGHLKGCVINFSSPQSCGGATYTEATNNNDPVVSFAVTPNLIVWKQLPVGSSTYSVYYIPYDVTAGANPLQRTYNPKIITQIPVSSSDALLSAAAHTMIFTTTSGDVELLDINSGDGGGTVNVPSVPQTILGTIPYSMSITSIQNQSAGGVRYEMAWEQSPAGSPNTWVLDDQELYLNPTSDTWSTVPGTNTQVDPVPNCTTVQQNSQQNCVHPLPAGQVKLSKNVSAPTNVFAVYSGTFCQSASGTPPVCTASSLDIASIALSISNPTGGAQSSVFIINGCDQGTSAGGGGPTCTTIQAFNNIDMEGSNAAWAEENNSIWKVYYLDVNPADNSQCTSGCQTLSASFSVSSRVKNRYARRSEVQMSDYAMALLDDRGNNIDGATELMYSDFTPGPSAARECPILTSYDAAIANCPTLSSGYKEPPPPGGKTFAGEILNGFVANPPGGGAKDEAALTQPELNLDNTVIGYRFNRPAAGNPTGNDCGQKTSTCNSYAQAVDASSPTPNPVIVDCTDPALNPDGQGQNFPCLFNQSQSGAPDPSYQTTELPSEVFPPALTGPTTTPSAMWVARLVNSTGSSVYELRFQPNIYATNGQGGEPPLPQVIYRSDPTKIASIKMPILVQPNGQGSPVGIFVATAGSVAANATDSIQMVTSLAPNQLPVDFYTTTNGRRITSIASDGYFIAWIERTVNVDGTYGAGNIYYTAFGESPLSQADCPSSTTTNATGQKCVLPDTNSPALVTNQDRVSLQDRTLAWSEADSSGIPQIQVINLVTNAGTEVQASQSKLAAYLPAVGTGGGTLSDYVTWIDLSSDFPVQQGGEAIWNTTAPTNTTGTGGNGGGGGPGGNNQNPGPQNPPIYVLDGFGGVHNDGSAPGAYQPYYPLGQTSTCPACGSDLARGLVVAADGKSGYTLDGYGGIHSWGQQGLPPGSPGSVRGDPVTTINGGAGWHPGWCGFDANQTPCPAWDIARGIALVPGSDAGAYAQSPTGGTFGYQTGAPGPNGYIVDGYGFVHAFGSPGSNRTPGSCQWCPPQNLAFTDNWAPASQGGHGGAYGWDIARGVVVNPPSFDTDANGGTHISGYVLDGFGGLHAFYEKGYPIPQPIISDYFGFDIAKAIVVPPGMTGEGYVLDGYGGLHPWSGRADGSMPPTPSLGDYCGAVALDPACAQFPGAPIIANWDIMRAVTFVDSTDGYIIDAYGIMHPALIPTASNTSAALPCTTDPMAGAYTCGGTPPVYQDHWEPGSTDGGPFGFDIVRGEGSGTSGSNGGGAAQGGAKNYHPPAVPECQSDAPNNPYGFNFCTPGNLIYHPPSDVCSYFNCIPNFFSGTGYMAECWDGTYSLQAGQSVVCQNHEGPRRPVYSH